MSDWIDWTGGECPVPSRTRVDVKLASGSEHLDTLADDWDWAERVLPVVAYRLHVTEEATRIAALEQQVKTLREVLDLADWYIDRLEKFRDRQPVRDLYEAEVGYRARRAALAATEDSTNG